MAEGPAPERNPAGFAGIRENVAGLSSSAAQYLAARLQLAREEAAEALSSWVKLVVFVVAAILLLGLAYLGFVAGLIVWVISTGWLSAHWVIFIATALHILGAIVLLLIAKLKFAVPGFQQSIEELKRDQSWLASKK